MFLQATPRTVRSTRKRTTEAEHLDRAGNSPAVAAEVLAVAAQAALPMDEEQQEEEEQDDEQRAAEPVADKEEEEAYTPARVATARKAPSSTHLLAAAMKTPLPGTPPKEDLQSPPPYKSGVAARKPRRGGAAGPSLGRLLSLAALFVAVAALAVPAWRKYDCGGALRENYPGAMQQVDRLAGAAQGLAAQLGRRAQAAVPASLAAAATQYHAAGQAAFEHHYQAAQRQCTYLWHTARQWLAERLVSCC